MITLTIITVGVFLLAGVIAVLHAAGHAPEGYEDEFAFHTRVKSAQAKVLAVAASVPSDTVERAWIEGTLTAHASTRAPQRPVGVY